MRCTEWLRDVEIGAAALSAHIRANIRLIELRAGLGATPMTDIRQRAAHQTRAKAPFPNDG